MTEIAAPALPRALSGRVPQPRQRTASFGDLVHQHWEHAQHPTDERARKRYAETRERFEDEHGKIVDDYWSKREPAGVALSCKRVRFGRLEWSLHRVMGNLAVGRSGYSPLLLRIARQSVRANSLLRGMTQRMATANLFALSRDIMASLEAKGDDAAQIQAYTRDLDYIAGYAGEAGKRAARVVYLKGLLLGVVAIAGAGAGAGHVLSSGSVPDVDPTLFVGSPGRRVAGRGHERPHPPGRRQLRRRPPVRTRAPDEPRGARPPVHRSRLRGAALLRLQGQPAQAGPGARPGRGEFAFFVTSSFAIGFSERFAKQIVRTAEAGAGGSGAAAPLRPAWRGSSAISRPGRGAAALGRSSLPTGPALDAPPPGEHQGEPEEAVGHAGELDGADRDRE